MRKVSRREFLVTGAAATVGAALAACQPQVIEKTVEVPVEVTKVVTEVEEVPVEVEKIVEVTPTPVAPQDYGGIEITGSMRDNYVTTMNEMMQNQANIWGAERGAKVTLSFPSNYREEVAACAEGGSCADCYTLFQGDPLLYSEKLVDVSDICEALAGKYGEWYDPAKQACSAGGKWLAIPHYYTAHAVNYRTDLFEEAGITKVPETYEELLEAGHKLKDAGLPPFGFPVSQAGNDAPNWVFSLLWAYGGAEVEEDGTTVAINSQATRDAIEYMVALAEVSAPDITAYDGGANNRNFLGGDIAATNNAASIYFSAQTDAPEVYANMGHFKYPKGPAGRNQFVEVNSVAIIADSPNVDATKDFLGWMLEEAQLSPLLQFGLTFASPLQPHYEDLPNMPWNVDPILKAFKEIGVDGKVPGYPGPCTRAAMEAYHRMTTVNMFANVLLGQLSIEESIEMAEEELKSIYEA